MTTPIGNQREVRVQGLPTTNQKMNETSKMITVTEFEEKSDQKQMKMERRGFDFYLQREREWWVLGRMKRVRWVIGKREERREREMRSVWE